MTTFIGNKPFWERGSLRSLSSWWRFGTFSGALLLELFGLNEMIRCSTKNNGTIPGSNTSFGLTSFCMPRSLGRGWLVWQVNNKVMLALMLIWQNPSSKVSTKLGVLGMSVVDLTIWESLGIGNVNVCIIWHFGWWLGSLGVVLGLVGWKWLLIRWLGGLSFGGVLVTWFVLLLFTWWCSTSKGPRPLKTGASSLILDAFWRWFFCPSVSKRKKGKIK